MYMQRTRLYSIILFACLGAYAWIGYQLHGRSNMQDETVCMIKNVTGIPCPSCGASRSVLSIIDGQFVEAASWNPVGYLLIALLAICPFWIFMDILFAKDSFLRFYSKTEKYIRNKWVAIPLIAFVAANWIWNILKEV